MEIPNLSFEEAKQLGVRAQFYAQRHAPKLSGISAKRIFAIFGPNYFGLRWMDPQVWYQNAGVRPFLMRNLQGKTIPMWIDDPTGTERNKNPKAKTRTTASGKTQVLIFRKVAYIGQRKKVTRQIGDKKVQVSVPASYPGAPGRITLREAGAPYTTPGKTPGAIAKGNIGIRWYFPGLTPRNFLQYSLVQACYDYGIQPFNIQSGYDFLHRPTWSNQQRADNVS